ncbi:glycoside hydrolase family 17 protein [Babjeviella inositovora NRRL Y-12698]|uniref:Glycoside hydrolase family 17 protein n=1 Tax=Babjeviella inositovora NRRL Y-12698 TaxID=984486 RepID=A0A1E3QIZ1_9ASCO|nr:glycoside hydrolase family 17 protein [Babjeviella inositovora NRRL Y-12698]ODQ77676.1 glycoside hydrolase family 17 protein [Babjeviella inositovora NRRL Y-12698]
MLFNSAIAAASLIATVAAAEHGHKHEKRDVVYVTETQLTTVTQGAAAGTAAAVAPAAAAVVSAVAQAKGAKTTAAAVTKASTTLTTAASSPTSSAGFNGGAKGITYSPYNADGTCKSLSSVQSDLAQMDDFAIIRLYGVDCNQVENVLQAKKTTQKVFAGIYFMDAITAGIQQLASAVSSYGSWDDIYTVSIGNELVNSGQATVSQIAGYVAEGRTALKAAGYTGPVVSVDTFIAVINNPGLCSYSDYMAVNAHAFFDGLIAAAGSGDWVLLQIQRVWSACNGDKDVLITETGWPSQGENNNVAVPSKANQEAAIASIKAKAGSSCILFNAFNDYWKADGAFAAEKYWGIL